MNFKRKQLLVGITLFLSCVMLAQLPTDIDLNDGWYLSWEDEFDYPDAQLENNWISANGSTDNDIVLCSRWRENVVVSDGILEIKAIKEERGGQSWTAGSIWTKSNDFKYGYYEARYKYAGATGTNNSFWLYPYSKADAGYNKVELDINEGQYPNILKTNIHNWTAGDYLVHPIQEKYSPRGDVDLAVEYHTYGVLWTPTEHIFYYDGEEIRREANPAYVQKNKWNTDGKYVYVENHGKTQMLLSLAILGHNYAGSVTDAIDGTSMKVDYVRYYKNDDLGKPASVTPISESEISVYPNPADDILIISGVSAGFGCHIYNLQGQFIKQIKLNLYNTIDLSQLKVGMYHYVINGDQELYHGSFVKK